MTDTQRIVKNEQAIGVVARDLAVLGEKVAAQKDTIRAFAPTAVQVAELQSDMDELKRELRDAGDRITRHMGEVYGAVERLRSDMNGRLRALEVFRAGVETLSKAFKWVPTLIGTVVGGTCVGVLVYVFTH